MMVYNTDTNGYVANYATIGDVENGVAYTGELPEGFADCPQAYKLVDGVLTLDTARYDQILLERAETETPSVDPTAALEQRIAELEAVIDALVGGEPA